MSTGCGISLVRPLSGTETATSGATDSGDSGGSGGVLSLATWLVQLGAVTEAPNAPATTNQGWDTCAGVATDSNGNIYCAGLAYGDISEADGGAGNGDAFVMKTNSDGDIQWVTQLGAVTKAPGAPVNANQEYDHCKSVAVDSSGNVYCAGFTDGEISEANSSGWGRDAFVMKLNSSGVIQWATQLGAVTKAPGAPVNANQGTDYCNGVAVDSSGNVYCAGFVNGAISEAAGGGGGDAFVMKLNSSGVIQWTTQLGAVTKAPGAPVNANQGYDTCNGVAVDSSGNVYCSGSTGGEISEAAGGNSDAFVMKLNSSGVIQWVTQLGAVTKATGAPVTANQGTDECKGVAVDSGGNVYCSGYTDGAISEAAGGSGDSFVMKLNSSGVIQWATQLGAVTKATGAPVTANQGYDTCNGVAVDSSGNVYCSGNTSGAIREATGGGGGDAFMMKLNSSGTLQWATQLGSATKAPAAPGTANQAFDICYGVAVDPAGNVICAGYTSGALSEATGGGSADIFVLKLDSTGAF